MGATKEARLSLAAALALSVVVAWGCATETGRSTVGGLVYGSMLGTTIAPGIGSAIGAGVGLVAGALEGAQREREMQAQEEAYREKFYRLRGEAAPAPSDQGAHPPEPATAPEAERFANLLALQDRHPPVVLIERGAEPRASSTQTRREGEELHPPDGATSPVASLYSELADLRRERRALEEKVGRLAALLEERDRSGRTSAAMVKEMEEALGVSSQEAAAARPAEGDRELLYLHKEYELARRLNNTPLAETIARRYESISGRPLMQGAVSSLPSGF